jgi:hypothetical protein
MNNTPELSTTEPYDYVIAILGPIIGFIMVTLCLRYTCYFCNGGNRDYTDEYTDDIDYNDDTNNEDYYI